MSKIDEIEKSFQKQAIKVHDLAIERTHISIDEAMYVVEDLMEQAKKDREDAKTAFIQIRAATIGNVTDEHFDYIQKTADQLIKQLSE